MKRIVSLLISLCMLMTCVMSVAAEGGNDVDAFPYSISLSDDTPAAGETFTVKIALTGYKDLEDRIRGIQVDVTNVDTSVFEVVDHSTLIDETGVSSNKTSYTESNKRIRLVYANSSSTLDENTTDLMQFRLKVKNTITADGSITLPVKFKIQAVSGQITESTSIVVNYKLEADVMSVDIAWGAMEFTYVNGVWDAETHKYGEGAWTCSTDSNKVSITNNSIDAVTAEIKYTAETQFSEITGAFVDSTNSKATECVIAADDSKTVYLKLTGKPNEEIDSQKIGSVTVTIQ